MAVFTFQSGDIQIYQLFFNIYIKSQFTFQSGDIQIYRAVEDLAMQNAIYIPIWWYSNHPKTNEYLPLLPIYIPIWWYSNNRWVERGWINGKFTFQSGDIQMLFHYICKQLLYFICIPIWWYSNDGHELLEIEINSPFTFQSGDIQIDKCYKT